MHAKALPMVPAQRIITFKLTFLKGNSSHLKDRTTITKKSNIQTQHAKLVLWLNHIISKRKYPGYENLHWPVYGFAMSVNDASWLQG